MKKFTDLRESNKGSVSVKTQQHDFGKMMTVHHGSNTSYPLHPEHQKAIKHLRPGDKTAFKDETGSQVHAHRVGDDVILHRPIQGSGLTKVPYHHFDTSKNEEVDQIDELSKDTLGGFIKKSKETFKDVPNAKKGNRLRNVLIAAGKRDLKKEEASSRVYKPEVERAFPASGVKTIVPKHKYSTMPKDKDKAKGVPAGSMYKEEIQSIEEGPKDPPWEKSASPFKKPNNPNRSMLDTVKALALKGKKEAEKKSIKEGYSEEDIANGGTVIFKADGKHHMSKVSHKTGGGAGTIIHTTAGHKVPLHHVVSTDASDWKGLKEATGDKSFDNTMKNIVKGTSKQRTADRIAQKKQNQERARNAFGSMFGGGNPTSNLKVKEDIDEGIKSRIAGAALAGAMALGAHQSAHSQSDNAPEHKSLTFSSQQHPEEHGRHLDIGGKLHHAYPKDAINPKFLKDTHIADNSSLGQRNQGKTYVHAFKLGDKHHYIKGNQAPFDSEATAKPVVKENIDEAKTNPTNVTELKNLMALAKVKKNYIQVHNPTNGKKVNENSLHADFLKMMNDKGIKHRVHGTPEQEKARTAEKLASNKVKVDASPKKPAGPGTFGTTRGYGQGRYMGD